MAAESNHQSEHGCVDHEFAPARKVPAGFVHISVPNSTEVLKSRLAFGGSSERVSQVPSTFSLYSMLRYFLYPMVTEEAVQNTHESPQHAPDCTLTGQKHFVRRAPRKCLTQIGQH